MSRLLSRKNRLGLLGLGLGMLLTGCNSLTGNKLDISEELPKRLVLSKLANLNTELISKKINNEELLSCMAPLLEENGLIKDPLIKNQIHLIPDLFDKLKNVSEKDTLLGFSGDHFQFKEIQGIRNIGDITNIADVKKVIEDLAPQKGQADELHLPFLLKHLLNFNLIKGTKDDEKIKEITRLYFDAYFSPAIENIKHEGTNKPGSEKNSPDSSKKPGFVARDGSKYSFSGLSKADGKLSIDHSQVGADIIRIFLEAVRDTLYPLPVSPDSTLAQIWMDDNNLDKKKLKDLKFNVDIYVGDGNSGRWTISGKPYPYQILENGGFNKIETDANKSEAAIATAVGKAIRGGFMGSLNNEALAKTIETAAGVISRQTTERFKWCSVVTQ